MLGLRRDIHQTVKKGGRAEGNQRKTKNEKYSNMKIFRIKTLKLLKNYSF